MAALRDRGLARSNTFVPGSFFKKKLICIFKLKQSFNLDSEYAGHLECKDG